MIDRAFYEEWLNQPVSPDFYTTHEYAQALHDAMIRYYQETHRNQDAFYDFVMRGVNSYENSGVTLEVPVESEHFI